MEKKASMDETNVSMLVTENQSVYMAARAKGTYFSADNSPDTAGKGIVKEPAVALVAVGAYPISYLLEILKLAKANKASKIKIELGRQDRPMRLEFVSGDSLNLERGFPKDEKTWAYIAPNIENDHPNLTEAQLREAIQLHENEIKLLMDRLPKEAPKTPDLEPTSKAV